MVCGRYAASASADLLIEEFELTEVTDSGQQACEPNFNVAPTDLVPAIIETTAEKGGARQLVGMNWGLVPSWAKDTRGAARLINARKETVAEKPSFAKAFATRRCLLPALGYYEWRAITGSRTKQPYFLRPRNHQLLVLGGIFEFFKTGDDWLITTSIITTQAVDELGWLHDRMPVVVPPENWDAWLDRGMTDKSLAEQLMRTPEPMDLDVYPVSTAVGRVANNTPNLCEPISVE